MIEPVPEPRIKRFEALGYGMFIHWGLYSISGCGEWTQNLHNIPIDKYSRLKDQFTASEFDAKAIAKLAKEAGMKYIVLTTRHHDGFSLYDTKGLSDYDAPHSPAGRDLIAEFVEGCRLENIVPFFYHTTLDWYQESFENDFTRYLSYLRQSVELLCTNYGQIGGLWFDGNWSKPDADWQLDKLYGMIRKLQPAALIINNTGLDERGEIGHSEIDSVTFEQGRPAPMSREGMEKYIAAEMCQTFNLHWGLAKRDFAYMSPPEIIKNLCVCRKVGANYLLNVGPTAEGRVPDYESAVLRRVGDWIKINRLPIYKGKPCNIKAEGDDFALQFDNKIYLFLFDLPTIGDKNVAIGGGKEGVRVYKGIKKDVCSVRYLDNKQDLKFSYEQETEDLTVEAKGYVYGTNLVVRVVEVNLKT